MDKFWRPRVPHQLLEFERRVDESYAYLSRSPGTSGVTRDQVSTTVRAVSDAEAIAYAWRTKRREEVDRVIGLVLDRVAEVHADSMTPERAQAVIAELLASQTRAG